MIVRQAPFSSAGLDAYRPLVGDETVDRLRSLAEPLRGASVLHVNATPAGGGVAELLLSLVPLMRDVGLEVDWYALEAEPSFFEVTKRYHNALQGQRRPWSQAAFDTYWEGCRRNAARLREIGCEYDFVVVHDPQPLLLRTLLPATGRWIWRCHVDMTDPHPGVWRAFAPHLAGYDMLVFSAPEYVPATAEAGRVDTALPCIDPFRPKNRPLSDAEVRRVPARYGVDPDRPYLLQVSRFDPWKDPVGVIEVFRRVRTAWPELQLVYMAAMAGDDPEAERVYAEARREADGDPDIRLLALDVPPERVAENALEVNAMQRGARVVLQKSLREGFGLVVTEALWKEKPVVAGDVGGIRYQICDGWNGHLVRSIDEAAERVVALLEDPAHAALVGRRGRAVVQARFLFSRLVEQYVFWFRELASGGRSTPADARSVALRTVPGSELPTLLASAGAGDRGGDGTGSHTRGANGR